ncbi:MAG: hypothetical protein R3C45_01720 [Phycisphaerales bacterium]
MSVIVLGSSLIPASAVFGYGPGNDKTHARELMDKASDSVTPDILYGRGLRRGVGAPLLPRGQGVMPVIKPVKHKDSPPGGEYRSLMTESG